MYVKKNKKKKHYKDFRSSGNLKAFSLYNKTLLNKTQLSLCFIMFYLRHSYDPNESFWVNYENYQPWNHILHNLY